MTHFANTIGRIRVTDSGLEARGGPYAQVGCTTPFNRERFSRPRRKGRDRRMPLLDGLAVATQLHDEPLPVRVVLFTLDADVFGELRDGVVVAKDAPAAVLLAAIRGPRRREPVVHAARPLRVLVVEDDEN